LTSEDASSQFIWDGSAYTDIWTDTSFSYDAATRVSTWNVTGASTYTVTYDHAAEEWELNSSPFEAEPFSHFYYDGDVHVMPNGVSYQYVYDASGGDAYWWDHGLYLWYDFSTQQWYAQPDDTWYPFVVNVTGADYFYDIYNDNTGWYELDDGTTSGTWFRHDGSRDAVYWWTYSLLHSAGQELWFTYDDQYDIWWWFPPDGTEWVEFTSPGDIDHWVFDGKTHIIGQDIDSNNISYYFDENRYGYYTTAGSSTVFCYDYELGLWWRSDSDGDVGTWYEFTGEGYDTYYIFDGHYHDLPNGLGFQYNSAANEGIWNVEGIEFIQDFDNDEWYVVDPQTGNMLLFHADDEYPTDFYLNEDWHEYDTGEWIRLDLDDGRIYWWTDNNGTHFYAYDLDTQQWFYNSTGSGYTNFTALSSEGEVPFFMFDTETYDVLDSGGAVLYSYYYSGSSFDYGYWDYASSDSRWSYGYTDGDWWKYDGSSWLTVGDNGADSRFIHDGLTYSFGSNFEYYFDIGDDVGYWSIDAGALNQFAYDYDSRDWYWVDLADGHHLFDPNNAGWDMLLYRQELQLGDAFSVEIDDLNGDVYWWLLDGNFGFRYDIDTTGWELYAEYNDSWVSFPTLSFDLVAGYWDWTFSGNMRAEVDLTSGEAGIFYGATEWFHYEMAGDTWSYYDFEVLSTFTPTSYHDGYWNGGETWWWVGDPEVQGQVNLTNNSQTWYFNGTPLYLRTAAGWWHTWTGTAWGAAEPYTGGFYYGDYHWNWFIDDHVSNTDHLLDDTSYWFYDLDFRFYVDDAGNWDVWSDIRNQWEARPYQTGTYDGAYTYNWSWVADARTTADVGMAPSGGPNSDQDWYFDGSLAAHYDGVNEIWYMNFDGGGLQATDFMDGYYIGSNNWEWMASWRTTGQVNLDNADEQWWFDGGNLYRYVSGTWDLWDGSAWVATPHVDGDYVGTDWWHWDSDSLVTGDINLTNGYEYWKYDGQDRFRYESNWDQWNGSSWVNAYFSDGWYAGSNWWHWDDGRITGDVDITYDSGTDRTEYYYWDGANLFQHINSGGWQWQVWYSGAWIPNWPVDDGYYRGGYDWWWDVDDRVDQRVYLDRWSVDSWDYRYYFDGDMVVIYDASDPVGRQFTDERWNDPHYTDGYYMGQGTYTWYWEGGTELTGYVHWDTGDHEYYWLGSDIIQHVEVTPGVWKWQEWNDTLSQWVDTDLDWGYYYVDGTYGSQWRWEGGSHLEGYVDLSDGDATTGNQYWERDGTLRYQYLEASDLWQEDTGSGMVTVTDVRDGYYMDTDRWNWRIDDRMEHSISMSNFNEYWLYEDATWYCYEDSTGIWWYFDGATWHELPHETGSYDGENSFSWSWTSDDYFSGEVYFDTGVQYWYYDADGTGAGAPVLWAEYDGATWYDWSEGSQVATSYVDAGYLGDRYWSWSYDDRVDLVEVVHTGDLYWRFDGVDRTCYWESGDDTWWLKDPDTGIWELTPHFTDGYYAGSYNWTWVGSSNVTSTWEFDTNDEYWYYNGYNRYWYDDSSDTWYEWSSGWTPEGHGAFDGKYIGGNEWAWAYYEASNTIRYRMEYISSGSEFYYFRIWDDGGDGFDEDRVYVFAPMSGGAVNYYEDREYIVEDAIYINASDWSDGGALANRLEYVYLVFGEIDLLAISNEGDTDVIRMAGDSIREVNYVTHFQSDWVQIGGYMASDGEIQFYASNIGAPGGGAETVLTWIAADTGVDVFASSDLTGTSGGGDWILEWGSNGGTRSGPSGQLIFNSWELDDCHWHRVT
jgi:hypothetical protein